MSRDRHKQLKYRLLTCRMQMAIEWGQALKPTLSIAEIANGHPLSHRYCNFPLSSSRQSHREKCIEYAIYIIYRYIYI